MKYIKLYEIFNERIEDLSYKNISKLERMGLLEDLSTDLTDVGLYVTISEDDPRFHEDGIYFVIEDKDQIFCKNYPEDEMDWLASKPIILLFDKRLADFGMIRGKNYKVYGGGLSATLIFPLR